MVRSVFVNLTLSINLQFNFYLTIKEMATDDMNKETLSHFSQCTKIGDDGEIITVSITTEESHQAHVSGN